MLKQGVADQYVATLSYFCCQYCRNLFFHCSQYIFRATSLTIMTSHGEWSAYIITSIAFDI